MENPVITDIDRRTCTRVVPMKVICAGMPRTGTLSLRTALKILGFEDTYHMVSCAVENQRDCEMWIDAAHMMPDNNRLPGNGKLTCLKATTDAPGCVFIPELVAAYPDAKVVLNKRDVDKWYNSVLDTIHKAHIANRELGIQGKRVEMLNLLWGNLFHGDFRKNGKEVWEQHYQMVRDLVPADNLLEFEAKDGWEPLCKFLGVPVPDVPYPRVNDTSNFWERYENGTGASLEKVNEIVAKVECSRA
ncbi:hypothetical protein H105_05310 [Trichophyton soudanense CBS 452.61]|uniref:Sulfotransferase domain-containing protein n=1 Tax=Trichophyton soudanense CBS 452.61 TaxID=1215331 RepID=A0A022XQU7_TRISD|nr:hypothetical protein H105_05310 [Trichophyton soudanense CBS 452.61]